MFTEIGQGIILIALCTIGLSTSVFAVTVWLWYKEHKRTKRFILDREYTEKEKGF